MTRTRRHPRLHLALLAVLLACATVAVVPGGLAAAAPDVVLVDLGDESAVAGWQTVNDPVMGGRSTSTIAFADGGLRFSGNISLDNGGGFASARGTRDAAIGHLAAGATSSRVRAVGDGKTYVLKAGATGLPYGYIQRFTTEAGVRRSYDLPIAGFQPVGQRFDSAPGAPQLLDPSSVDQMAVYILDEQQGPFAITISGIDAT